MSRAPHRTVLVHIATPLGWWRRLLVLLAGGIVTTTEVFHAGPARDMRSHPLGSPPTPPPPPPPPPVRVVHEGHPFAGLFRSFSNVRHQEAIALLCERGPAPVGAGEPVPAWVRQCIEQATAAAIVEREEIIRRVGYSEAFTKLFIGDANGLMGALRLLGGYEDTTFNVAWAHAVLTSKQGHA